MKHSVRYNDIWLTEFQGTRFKATKKSDTVEIYFYRAVSPTSALYITIKDTAQNWVVLVENILSIASGRSKRFTITDCEVVVWNREYFIVQFRRLDTAMNDVCDISLSRENLDEIAEWLKIDSSR